MTDLEISKVLALAIGWPEADVFITAGMCLADTHNRRNKVKVNSYWMHGCRVFDHKDWTVIGPIAERYNCFPYAHRDVKSGLLDGKWVVWPNTLEDTPQKAIALAVIGLKK